MLAWKWPEIADRPFYVSYCMSVHLYSAVRHNSIGRPKQSRLQYLNPLYKFRLQILQVIDEEIAKHSDPSQSAWDRWETNYQQKAKQDRQDRQKTSKTGKRPAILAEDWQERQKTGKRPTKDRQDRKDRQDSRPARQRSLHNWKKIWLKLRQCTAWPEPIWIKVKKSWQIPLQHQCTYLGGPESPFQTSLHKFVKNCFLWTKFCFTMFTFRGTFT